VLPLLLGMTLATNTLASEKAGSTPAPQVNQTSSRWIVTIDESQTLNNGSAFTQALSKDLNKPVKLIRRMSGHSLVVSIQHEPGDAIRLQKRISKLPTIQSASRDARVTTQSVVDDPRFAEQWQLHAPEKFTASMDVQKAWSVTHGSSDVVVAIVDTGIDYSHPDLQGRLLQGYDFVSELSLSVDEGIHVPDELQYMRSHDGDGRDDNASDPGDAINETIRTDFASLDIECYVGNSTWHGTAMASIIAANPNDGVGIAGIDWHAKILPVRAIGKCGGRRSDMLDAIRWAAGVEDPALPPNPTPARIINLSLGVDDLCTAADQAAINEAIAAGALIVAAVGNNGRNTDTEPSSPSHCQNVMGVMAVDKHGFRARYSNVGRDADVAAPGGDVSFSEEKIWVATNNGKINPANDFGYRPATGTSVAAPHVAGVLALMLSIQPDLTNRELQALLLDSARDFPGEDDPNYSEGQVCEKSFCGSGILDAYTAVMAVDNHQPGTFLDSPELAAAQSVPVSVGGFTGFGCTVMNRSGNDAVFLLMMITSMAFVRRRRKLNA